MKRTAVCLFLLSSLVPAAAGFGQTIEAPRIFGGDHPPYALKLKDLNASWLALRLAMVNAPKSAPAGENPLAQLMGLGAMGGGNGKDKGEALGEMLGMSLFSGMLGGGGVQETPVYYTQGQTLNLAGEMFLVVYSQNKTGLNLMEMALQSAKSGEDKEPDFAKLAAESKLGPESSLSLSLINVKTIATLSGLRPFDMNQEIVESAKGAGGLLQLIADQTAKEKQAAKTIPARPAPPKRAASPRKL